MIASPSIYPAGRNTAEIEIVNGVPQNVIKIDLVNDVERGLTGLALPELLDRVIIGPCAYPFVTAVALARLMSEAGVEQPFEHIVSSDIPLRHSSGA